ncbi:hypothetical protein ACFL4U_02185 [Candidatus Neomarinimicrobiota bacterium]
MDDIQYGDQCNIRLKWIQGQEVYSVAEFSVQMPGTAHIDTVIPVAANGGRTRVILEFDSLIRTGTVEDVSLTMRRPGERDWSPLPLEGLTVTRRIYTASEPVQVMECESGRSEQAFRWSIDDHEGQVLLRGVWEAGTGGVSPGRLPSGWYRLHSRLQLQPAAYETQTVFVVVPATGRKDAGVESAFGIHMEMSERGLYTMEQLGAGWTRLHGADILKWKSVESEPGTWIWPDTVIALFTDAGKAILGNLGQTPDWASSQPQAKSYPHPSYYFGAAAYLPEKLEDWETYVAEVVNRYRDHIRHWEVWNEPDIHFLVGGEGGKAGDYSTLLTSAQRIIKNIDPDLTVFAPAVAYLIAEDRSAGPKDMSAGEFLTYRDPAFFQKLTALTPGPYFDVFSFHHYSRIGTRQTPEALINNRHLETLARDVATWYSDKKDLWITEYNVLADEPSPNPRLEGRLARQLCLDHFDFFARGIAKVFTYNAMYNELWFSPFDNFYQTPAPTQVFAAYAVLTSMLDGLRFERIVRGNDSQPLEYIFAGPGLSTIHIFAAVAGDTKFSVPVSGTLIDYLGQERFAPERVIHILGHGDFVYFRSK